MSIHSHRTRPTDPPKPIVISSQNSCGTAAPVVDYRLRRFASRIGGLDLARAVAVLGMFTQHFYRFPTLGLRLEDPSSWPALVNNNSTVLFAVLAGASKSLIDGGRHPRSGPAQLQARMSIVARAIMLFAISGILITLVPTPGSVLGYIAAGFIISLPFLRMPGHRLLVLAAVGVVVVPYPVHILREIVYANTDEVARDSSLNLLVTGLCPALIFLPLFLLGIALGRMDLRDRTTQFRIGGYGFIITTLTFAISTTLTNQFGTITATSFSSNGSFRMPDWKIEYFLASPHLNGVLQMTEGVGISLVVIGVCLFLTSIDPIATLTYPLRALGMCAFTAYVAQFAAVAIVIDKNNYEVPDGFLIILSFVLIVFSSIAIALFGRGPLESAMTEWARWMSRIRLTPASATPPPAPTVLLTDPRP